MIDNTEDVIDSRDVIARIEDLENMDTDLDAEDRAELDSLRDLAHQGESFPDWVYGETLIRDSYFETYTQELAEDIGALKDQSWPYTCIDWEQAARELQMDYSSIDFAGETYWIRS